MTPQQPDSAEPRPPGVMRQFWSGHPKLRDSLLSLALFLIAALAATPLTDDSLAVSMERIGYLAFATFLICLAVLPLLVRQRHPWWAAAATVSVLALSVWSPSQAVVVPTFFALYSLATVVPPPHAWAAAAAAEGLAVLACVVGQVASPASWEVSSPMGWAIQYGGFAALAVALGTSVQNRRQYLKALVDRARRLELERDQKAQLAVAADRARIAREMHDVVSHSLTVMITLAEGAAVALDEREPRVKRAVEQAADAGRGAMTDMRRMLGVLGGSSAAELTPQPNLADLEELVAGSRAASLPVRLEVAGPIPPDPTLQLAVYRIVQEALTNALRYATRPTDVTVSLRFDDHVAAVIVTDNGLVSTHPQVGSGLGLRGLVARASALGGVLRAGPRSDGPGWELQAEIPLHPRT